MSQPLPESSETAGSDVGPGKPPIESQFKPGQSGNPGGRQKGIARKVRELFDDDDGETIVRFLQGVMAGEVVTITIDEHGEQKRSYSKANVKERIEAAKLLMERGWGKPPQYAPIEDDDPLDLSERKAAQMADDLDARIDEVARKRLEREQVAQAATAEQA